MKRIDVVLKPWEASYLRQVVNSGVSPAREILHARALLLSWEGISDRTMSEAGISRSMAWRVRRAYVEGGLGKALPRKAQPPRPEQAKVTDEMEVRLVALACSKAPAGRTRWSVRLLADKTVELLGVGLSRESVRQTLKKTNSNLGGSTAG